MTGEVNTWKPSKESAPFKDFGRIRREIDKFWDSFLGRESGEKGKWVPCIDVAETKDDIIVEAEVPGIDPKDIDISLTDGRLIIKGEKKQAKQEKTVDRHLAERSYGGFARTIELPMKVQGEKIAIAYNNGVLKIVVPKSDETKKQAMKIKVE